MIPILSSRILCLSRFLQVPGAHGPSQWTKFWLEPCLQTSASRLIRFTKQAQFLLIHFFNLKFLEPYNIYVSLCIGSVSWYHLSISMSFTFSRRTLCIPWNPTVKELDRALDPNRQICYSIQFIGFICILTGLRCLGSTKLIETRLRGGFRHDINKKIHGFSVARMCFWKRKPCGRLEELLCSQLSFWRCKKLWQDRPKGFHLFSFLFGEKDELIFFHFEIFCSLLCIVFTTIKASNFPVPVFYYRGTLNGLKETMTSLVMAYHAESASTEQLSGFPKQHLDMICNVCINRCKHINLSTFKRNIYYYFFGCYIWHISASPSTASCGLFELGVDQCGVLQEDLAQRR